MELKKQLKPIDIWGLALGSIIGWGCFVLPSTFLQKAGPVGTIIGIFLGGLIISIIAINYSYLIKKYPVAGGEFFYAYELFGKRHALFCGWFLVLAYISIIALNATAIGMIGRYLFPGILQVGLLYEIAGWQVYLGEILVGVMFIVLFAIFNIKGAKIAGWIQGAISLLLVGTILLIAAITCLNGITVENLQPMYTVDASPIQGILAIVAMSPWLYIGFDCIPQAAEEYNFSHKKTLGILLLAIFLGALLYSVITIITAVVFPWVEYIQSNPFWATGEAVYYVMGNVGLALLGIAMFCGVISGINGFYIATSRLLYSMAKKDALPEYFGEVHKKYYTPANSIKFVMVVSLIAPFMGREVLGWIVDMTSVSAAIAYLYTSLAAAKIAVKDGDKKQMVIGVMGGIVSLMFLVLLLVPGMPGALDTQSMIMLVVWSLLGLSFYYKVKPIYMEMDKVKSNES